MRKEQFWLIGCLISITSIILTIPQIMEWDANKEYFNICLTISAFIWAFGICFYKTVNS